MALLRRSPAFTASAVLTLAIGVGANTGIYSLLEQLLRPLPVPHADQIVILAADVPSDRSGLRYKFSYPAFIDYREQTGDVFSAVFGFETRLGGITIDGKTTQFVYHGVTSGFFDGLQLSPSLGRFFAGEEGQRPGDEALLVLGHAFWQTRLGSDPSVIGTVVRVDGLLARVIGVAPPGFRGMYVGVEVAGYMPLASASAEAVRTGDYFVNRRIRALTLVARLRPDVALETAQIAANLTAMRLNHAYPAIERATTTRVVREPMARPLPLRFTRDLLPLIRAATLALAALVLLIACMNVINLLLVRASARQREMAVRAALGSGRAPLIRLMLIESLVLAIAGSIAGVLVARWAAGLYVSSLRIAIDLPLAMEIDYDWHVFTYATAITAVTGIVMGLVPAWRASRGEVNALLHDGGRSGSEGGTRQRLRSTLVVAQLAGSFILLVVAGLFIRSVQQLDLIDVGFEPQHVLTLRTDPRQVGYTPAQTTAFYDALGGRVRALPAVESAAFAFAAPMGYYFDVCALLTDGAASDDEAAEEAIACNSVGDGYFETMKIPLVRGRTFTAHDSVDAARVAIVNETMARQQWPDSDAIGKRLRLARLGEGSWRVVGVVRDSKYLALFENPLPHIYLPILQNPLSMRVLHVRSAVPPDVLAPQLQQEIAALDPDVPIADVKTMTQLLQSGMGVMMLQWGMMQAAALGVVGLLLAVVGVYGVTSYAASQRSREMAIRLALGAEPRGVRRLVLRQGSGLVIAGVSCGVALAAAVTQLIARFFVVSAIDMATFVLVAVLLAGVALLACYLPARRAMLVDPITVLRHE